MRLHAGSLRNRCFVCFSARVQGRQARPPRRGAMAVKISAREEKAANKEAEAVLASLSRAGEAAVTQTLDDIREVLKKDAPLMYHINALLHNQEWTAVLKASINGIAAVAASGDKPGKGWRLRAGIRKFGHLERRVVQLLCFPRIRVKSMYLHTRNASRRSTATSQDNRSSNHGPRAANGSVGTSCCQCESRVVVIMWSC